MCEDVQMWREDVKMWRCEDVKVWRCEGVKMICVDVKMKMWRWEDVYEPPLLEEPFAQTLSGIKAHYYIIMCLYNISDQEIESNREPALHMCVPMIDSPRFLVGKKGDSLSKAL